MPDINDHSVGMTEEDIIKLIEYARSFVVELPGDCFVCKNPTMVVIKVDPEDGKYMIEGGAVWKKEDYIGESANKRLRTTYTVKCDKCYEDDKCLRDQKTEVFARVVGYLRPLQTWNPGKREEFEDRKTFKVE